MSETLLVAVVAAASAILGSIVGIFGQLVTLSYNDRRERKKDEQRRRLLRLMLEDDRYDWRNLDTLRHVIGTDAETAKRLLLDVGARASENGQSLWGLCSRHPLGRVKQ